MTPKQIGLAATLAALMSGGVLTGAAQQQEGSIHGHVTSPIGVPITDATVQVSTDGKDAKYTFPTDANGDFKGTGIAPGTYFLNLFQGTKPIDQLTNVKIVAGQDELENFDMTREEYMSKLKPEERKQIEEVRAKNAATIAGNAVIKNINADLATARADIKAKNYADADALMTKDTAAKPEASILWVELGNAQAGEKKWDDANTSFNKAVQLESANPKPNPEVLGSAQAGLGEVLAGQNKLQDAANAYDAAAKANPASAGVYYANETIVLSRNPNGGDATVAAADKAIAADPSKPIPYYLKGQALMNKATVDPKTNKITAPPQATEAYQKYLELAPDGQFAPEVKSLLAELGEKVQTSYHAKGH